MIYETLTADDQMELARRRVQQLERAHFALRLRLAEVDSTQEDQEIRGKLAELERRHKIHVTPPEPPEPDKRTDERGADDQPPADVEPPADTATDEPDPTLDQPTPDDAELVAANGRAH